MGMVIIYNKTMHLFLSEAANSSIMLSVFKFLVTSSVDKIARLEILSSSILVLNLFLRVEKDLSLSALVTVIFKAICTNFQSVELSRLTL